jgi:spermidine/putrescine transport system ATP-binding protein
MNMHKKLGITFVYVTHDQEEALTMSDTIVVMRGGEIQQIGTPQKVYDEPANAFVADFIGESNIYSGIMRKDFVVEIAGREFECVDKGFKANEPVDVIIRPEDIKVVKKSDKYTFEGTVNTSVFKGDHYETIVLMDDEFEVLVHDNVECVAGDKVYCYIKPFDFHIMAKARITNSIDTYMWDEENVEICGEKFPVNVNFPEGAPVTVEIGFTDVEVMDDEEDGIIGGEVINSIYKGNYYQCIIRTDDHYDFFVDTQDDWLKGDRVGIRVAPEKIKVSLREEKADE